MLTDAIEVGVHLLCVGEGLLTIVVHVVGFATGISHLTHQLLDGCDAMRDVADQFLAIGTQFVVLLLTEGLTQAAEVLQQSVLVAHSRWHDVVDGQIAQHTALYLLFLDVLLQLHFDAALQLALVEDALSNEHGTALGILVVHQGLWHAADIRQATTVGLFLPFLRIAIALEMDRRRGLDVFLDHAEDGFAGFHALFHEVIHAGLELVELVGHRCIDGDHGACAVG